MSQSNLKTIVRGCYDLQQLRIQTGNRITGNFKAKLGQEPSMSEEMLDAESRELLAKIRSNNKLVTAGAVEELEQEAAEKKEKKIAGLVSVLLDKHYKQMTADGVPRKAKFVGNPVISDYTELCLISQYKALESQEATHFKMLGNILKDYPIYTEFLEPIKGIGPAMAGVIISEIDITKARHPSSLWKYAGLDVADDGRGRSRRSEHLTQKPYINKEGKQATRIGITFNPFLKTKLTGVLAASFLRAGDNKYSQCYNNYKNRLESSGQWEKRTIASTDLQKKDTVLGGKGHRHNASLRYMVKIFLIDLHIAWRGIAGLPVSLPYHEAKLGHVHGQTA